MRLQVEQVLAYIAHATSGGQLPAFMRRAFKVSALSRLDLCAQATAFEHGPLEASAHVSRGRDTGLMGTRHSS